MKKKSSSQSAFFNLRVLFGLCVMLAGVFLALVGFGPARTGFAQGTTREEMTLTLAKALAIEPPPCVPGSEMFTDVPASNPFCPWIEELSRRGITGGCAPGLFCPGDPVSRQQMAVFIVKAMDAITQSEDFHLVGQPGEPPFQGGWSNFGFGFSQAGFFKDALGIVHLKGFIIGPSGTSAFTLPAGYYPGEISFMPIAGSAGGPVAAYLQLQNGPIFLFCAGGGTCSVGLDGLSFRVP
jgi:S-layer homology domain